MRATMELYGDSMEYPAIHAQIALGTEDLTVKVKLRWFSLVWSAEFMTDLLFILFKLLPSRKLKYKTLKQHVWE